MNTFMELLRAERATLQLGQLCVKHDAIKANWVVMHSTGRKKNLITLETPVFHKALSFLLQWGSRDEHENVLVEEALIEGAHLRIDDNYLLSYSFTDNKFIITRGGQFVAGMRATSQLEIMQLYKQLQAKQ